MESVDNKGEKKKSDSKFNQVSVRSLDHSLEVDSDKMQATISAGASYGQICEELYQQGRNLAPDWTMPLINLGRLYLEWGKYELAI